MLKKILCSLSLVIFSSCATSPYVGQWQSSQNGAHYDLTIDSDGTVQSIWTKKNGQKLNKSGEWKELDDGSISIEAVDAQATAKLNGSHLELKNNKKTLVLQKAAQN